MKNTSKTSFYSIGVPAILFILLGIVIWMACITAIASIVLNFALPVCKLHTAPFYIIVFPFLMLIFGFLCISAGITYSNTLNSIQKYILRNNEIYIYPDVDQLKSVYYRFGKWEKMEYPIKINIHKDFLSRWPISENRKEGEHVCMDIDVYLKSKDDCKKLLKELKSYREYLNTQFESDIKNTIQDIVVKKNTISENDFKEVFLEKVKSIELINNTCLYVDSVEIHKWERKIQKHH